MKEAMKEKLNDLMEKFCDLCDSGKPWYFFLGAWTVLLMLALVCQIFSEEKPKWWNWVLIALGYVNVFRDLKIAKQHRDAKAAEADV